jgi:leucine dehydrogenase
VGAEREALLLDFGDLVESLGGRYITAEDVGTSEEDMVVISDRTRHVTGMPAELGGAGDPSPFTAMGVQAAMRAASAAAFGTPDLAGRTVAVSGLGHVGEKLANGLHAAGAKLIVSDVDPRKQAVAEAHGYEWAEPAVALETDCDIASPCAVGGAIHADNIDRLGCRVICGAANNQLADESLAAVLAEGGVVYAPDFIANAGGLINVYRELHEFSEERARELSLGIEGTMGRILAQAKARSVTPLEAARELAAERLSGRSRTVLP